MLKKIALAVTCFCCLFQLGSCKSDPAHQPGTPEFKANFCYEAFWYFQGDDPDAGQNVPDGYSFLCGGKIYVYSVADREIIQVLSSKNSRIDDYAINDDYVFFVTGKSTVPGSPNARLWKYDRKTDTCELFTEISKYNRHLELHQGYVFYGEQDVNVCPIDGDPEEDSISLLAQFPDGVSAYKMRDVVYQGWRIRRERDYSSDRILFIKDEETAKVILKTTSSSDGVWLDLNGELIRFPYGGGDFYYQRENEQEKHFIDCLEESYYGMSGIGFHKLAVEDGKIICLISVSKHPRMIEGLSQSEVKEDILVEIDIEEGTDRIIYNTGDNKTRIIGYRGGELYLIEDDIIYRQGLEDGDREKVFELRDGSVALYDSGGSHTSIYFIVWGDNLIVRPYDGTKGMFTIPLFNQAEDIQEERN